MSGFEPGEGWREVSHAADVGDGDEVRWRSSDDLAVRYWVREVPVSPLPTEPYTVIRVRWEQNDYTTDLVLVADKWAPVRRGVDPVEPTWLAENITGFKVLAEPRPVTTKAVLDRIASEPWAREVDLAKWRREFGVSS